MDYTQAKLKIEEITGQKSYNGMMDDLICARTLFENGYIDGGDDTAMADKFFSDLTDGCCEYCPLHDVCPLVAYNQ